MWIGPFPIRVSVGFSNMGHGLMRTNWVPLEVKIIGFIKVHIYCAAIYTNGYRAGGNSGRIITNSDGNVD